MKISVLHPSYQARISQIQTEFHNTVEWNFVAVSDFFSHNNKKVNSFLESSESDYYIFTASEFCLSSKDKLKITNLIQSNNEFDFAYADSWINRHNRKDVLKRPAPEAERLRCQNYLGEMLIFKASFFKHIGGFIEGAEGAEIYDLILRSVRLDADILHVNEPLYTSLNCEKECSDWSLFGRVDLQILQDVLTRHLQLTGGGNVVSVSESGVHDTRRIVDGNPLVSIIIPTRAQKNSSGKSYLLQTIQSVIDLSTYSNFEIVLVVDEGFDVNIMTQVRLICRNVTLIELVWKKPFNFSDKINAGAVSSNGEFVLLLNDDVKVISPSWVESMLALAQLPSAGLSGAMLYFEDETIQHAGHAYRDGEVSHVGLDEPRNSEGPICGYKVEREIAGVTAACCMTPRNVFFEVGGFTGLLPGAFNDVDFSLKVSSSGRKVYWTPHAELYHFESKSRDASVRAFEIDVLRKRWGHKLIVDHYWPYRFTRPV